MPLTLPWTVTQATLSANSISLSYTASWDVAGAFGSGPCGIGQPAATSGSPWGGLSWNGAGGINNHADIAMPDFMSNPAIIGWNAMTIFMNAIGGANIAWACPCGFGCSFSNGLLTAVWYDAGGAPLLDFMGNPNFAATLSLGGGFQLGSGNPLTPEFFDPVAYPPPTGTYFEVFNDGNHIHLDFEVFIVVYFPGPVTPPPPPPPPWPTPPPPAAPPCGAFTPF